MGGGGKLDQMGRGIGSKVGGYRDRPKVVFLFLVQVKSGGGG